MNLVLYAIAPTQYTESGEVDTGAIAANVERMVDAGIDRFLLTGAYGEFQSLTDDERVAITRAVAATGAASAVMSGAAHPSTDQTAALAVRLFDAGATEVMVAPPMLAELDRRDVMRHFETLASRFSTGLVAYNNPVLGPTLSPGDLVELGAMTPFTAVKQGVTRIGEVIESLHAVRESGSPMAVIAASDLAAVATLAAGLDGLSSTNSWVFPQTYRALVTAAGDADVATMRRIASALEPYHRVVRRLGQPRTVKAAMVQRGYAGSSYVRLPHLALDDADGATLQTAIEEADQRLEAIGLAAAQWATA